KRSVKRSKKRSVKRSKKRSVKRSKKRSVKRSKKRSVKRSKKRSVKRSVKHSVKRSKKRSVKRSKRRSVKSVKRSKLIAPMLAKVYKAQDVSGWFMSEKLDGIRAVFQDGEFWSRTGKSINAPEWFKEKTALASGGRVLDGELFTKPNDFSGVMSVVSKKVPIDSEWKRVKYMAFDLPLHKGVFKERVKELDKIKKSKSNVLRVVTHLRVRSMPQVQTYHDTIVAKGGEGVMLNNPDALYQNKRSGDLLKFIAHMDAEVIVQGFELGTGSFSDIMGKLFVKWKKDTGVIFKVGTGFSIEQRKNHAKLFPKGTILKIRFKGINPSGKARMPSYYATIPKRMAH
ncbi:DNA ligase domain-containing protein, partial [Mimivirus AB-566-O17]